MKLSISIQEPIDIELSRKTTKRLSVLCVRWVKLVTLETNDHAKTAKQADDLARLFDDMPAQRLWEQDISSVLMAITDAISKFKSGRSPKPKISNVDEYDVFVKKTLKNLRDHAVINFSRLKPHDDTEYLGMLFDDMSKVLSVIAAIRDNRKRTVNRLVSNMDTAVRDLLHYESLNRLLGIKDNEI